MVVPIFARNLCGELQKLELFCVFVERGGGVHRIGIKVGGPY